MMAAVAREIEETGPGIVEAVRQAGPGKDWRILMRCCSGGIVRPCLFYN